MNDTLGLQDEFIDQHASLTFLNYNVCGLLNKMNDSSFVNSICKYDFVSITETFVSYDFQSDVFSDFCIFTSYASKLSHHGRYSGGVIVLAKKKYSKYFQRIKTDVPNTVILQISKELTNYDKDVLFVSSYIPPDDSPFWRIDQQHGSGVELLEKCIADLYEKYDDMNLFICGDLNARTGTNNFSPGINNLSDILFDKESFSYARKSQDTKSNTFGDQLIEFCNIFDCLILNGLEENNFDDSCTYISERGCSLVDYFIMSCCMFNNTLVQSLKVLDFVDSDHLPVEIILNVGKNSTNKHLQYDNESETVTQSKWNKTKASEYRDNLAKDTNLEILKSAHSLVDIDINGSIEMFTKYLTLSSKCMVKTVKKKSNDTYKCKSAPWFCTECREAKQLCRKKLKTFKRTRSEESRKDYIQTKKIYKSLIKQKKLEYNKSFAESLVNSLNDSSTFWDRIKQISSDSRPKVSDNITIQQWYTHFQNVFSGNDNQENFETYEVDDEINDHELNKKISIDEVKQAIVRLNNGKACGTDGVFAEMLKEGGSNILDYLYKLFNTIFDSGQYPEEWFKAIVIPIFKKGDIDKPDNYRGISLINVLCKCYTSVLNSRLYKWLEESKNISENQAGFRKDYSTIDQIFTLYGVVQKCLTKKKGKLYVAFIDFHKAFDSVNHSKLFEILQSKGIRGKFFATLKSMYNGLLSCVRVNGSYSEFFDCPVGVRQGCVMSPTLFCLFIDQLANFIDANGVHGVQLMPSIVELFILLFADDIVLMSTTPGGLQSQLNALQTCCKNFYLKVNTDKTKVMVFRKGGYLGKCEKWFFEGRQLDVVNKYCYLGFNFTTMLSGKIGVTDLVVKGKKAVYLICRAFQKCKQMVQRVFFRVFESKVLSILLYSSEIWGLERLECIEKVHLLACKRFLGVPTKTPNKMVYSELTRYPIFVNSYLRVIKYWIRLLQMDENRLPKQVYRMLLQLDNNGKKNWVTQVREILSTTGFYFVWHNQRIQHVNSFLSQFKQRLVDIFIQEWSSTIRIKERYTLYSTLIPYFGNVSYLNIIDIYCFRVALTQIRLGVLPINSNMKRYSVNLKEMMCPFCENVVENEVHFLNVCPMYNDLRCRFLHFTHYKPLQALLGFSNQAVLLNVAKYIFYAIKKRREYMMHNA